MSNGQEVMAGSIKISSYQRGHFKRGQGRKRSSKGQGKARWEGGNQIDREETDGEEEEGEEEDCLTMTMRCDANALLK